MIRRAAAVVALLLHVASCSAPSGEETQELRLPTCDDFAYVAPTMVRHCGSLDCHGAVERNLRLYGQYGLRLDPRAVSHEDLTSAAEVEFDCRATIGLEPELTADVFASHGTDPERLTVVRKARGLEKHVGQARFPEGSLGDRCLVSFISGAIDGESCISSITEDP